MLEAVDKSECQITTEDLRKYLDDYQKCGSVSKVTLDNVRRILSSFFSWLEDEDYIVKSPVRRQSYFAKIKIIDFCEMKVYNIIEVKINYEINKTNIFR